MASFMRTALLMAFLTALFYAIGLMVGGSSGATAALLVASVMNFGAYWFSDRIVLSMHRAREVTARDAPALHGMVAELCERASIPMPRVCIMQDPSPNAFATGRNPSHSAVAVTTGLLDLCPPQEVHGVLAHELGHIKNRDILVATIAATFAGAVGMLSHMLYWTAMFGRSHGDDDDGGVGALGAIFAMIFAPLVALLIQMAISRAREYGADRTGAEIAGSPHGLARALERLGMASGRIPMRRTNEGTAHLFIVSPLRGGLTSLFSTHPPIEERVRRLRVLAES